MNDNNQKEKQNEQGVAGPIMYECWVKGTCIRSEGKVSHVEIPSHLDNPNLPSASKIVIRDDHVMLSSDMMSREEHHRIMFNAQHPHREAAVESLIDDVAIYGGSNTTHYQTSKRNGKAYTVSVCRVDNQDSETPTVPIEKDADCLDNTLDQLEHIADLMQTRIRTIGNMDDRTYALSLWEEFKITSSKLRSTLELSVTLIEQAIENERRRATNV